MQDKIIVTPSEVRGLGNIVSEKELEDFLVYMSTITSISEEVDGITRKVYALGYVPPQVSLTLTLEKTVLDYDEHTNLIATLLDENNVPIPNEEVKFYNENSYLFYTGTTDSNGVITINIYSHQPGQHTYTGILSSDTTVTGSVTVTINKITSTLSLATSSGSVNVGGTFTLSGTLNAGSGQSVKIYENGTLIDTVTTGSGGAYSKSITASSAGSFAYTAVFDGTSVYTDVTSSAVSVNVIAPSYDDIVVSADNQILSYYDSEKATLYAQLQDNGSDAAVSGVTITFKQGNTTLGTAQTDNTGKATLVDGYTSAGVGDVTITATDGVLVSERYIIQDCLKVYTGTYLAGTRTVTQSFNYTLPSTFKIEFDYKLTSFNQANSTYMIIGETDSKALLIGRIGNDSQYSVWVRNNGDVKYWGSDIQTSNEYQTLSIVYNGASFVFNDDITVTDLNGVNLTSLLKVTGWHDTANQGTVTNIKIKPL